MTEEQSRAWGFGLATVTESGTVLDTWYPAPELGGAPADAEPPKELLTAEQTDEVRQVRRVVVLTAITLGEAPADASDAYLRLHLISHRLVHPHGLNLDGVFGVLPNNAWTSLGPVPPDQVAPVRLRAIAAGRHL